MFFSQAVHIPRPFSRRHSPSFLVAIANSTSTKHSPAACSAPAASRKTGVWTVAVVTAAVHWCVSDQEGVGWCTGLHPGVMPAGHNNHLVCIPKCLRSVPGYARWWPMVKDDLMRRHFGLNRWRCYNSVTGTLIIQVKSTYFNDIAVAILYVNWKLFCDLQLILT